MDISFMLTVIFQGFLYIAKQIRQHLQTEPFLGTVTIFETLRVEYGNLRQPFVFLPEH